MLAIRMQRRGRKGHAQFRVILQDSHRSPSSGKVSAHLGSYNPHTKEAQLDTEKIEFYLKNGAQPSNRAALLFKKEGIKLPAWVTIDEKKKGTVKNPEKYGSTEEKTEAPAGDEAAPAEDSSSDEAPAEPTADNAEESKESDDDAEKKE